MNIHFINQLQLSLVPFFFTSTSKDEFYGPFLGLESETQENAIDLLYYLPQWKDKLIQAVVVCSHSMILLVYMIL